FPPVIVNRLLSPSDELVPMVTLPKVAVPLSTRTDPPVVSVALPVNVWLDVGPLNATVPAEAVKVLMRLLPVKVAAPALGLFRLIAPPLVNAMEPSNCVGAVEPTFNVSVTFEPLPVVTRPPPVNPATVTLLE